MLRLPPGGTLSLECTVSHLIMPPEMLHWKHKNNILTPTDRSGVSLESQKLAGISHTKLVIVDLKPSDEGSYECVTDVSRAARVQLFIGKMIQLHIIKMKIALGLINVLYVVVYMLK